MIQIIGPQLSQWDTGRRISVSGSNATHAHLANRGDSHAVIMELENGETKIPDYLLQTGKDLYIYLVLDGITQESKTFSIRKRERPENYVYEDDRRNYIYELITDALAAAEEANQAAGTANQAAGAANNAAQNATKAATSANDAAGNANVAWINANEAAKNANDAATKAAHTAKSLMVIGGADGTVINLDNAADQVLVGLRVFGKTTQDRTPTPDAPVELVSVGYSGSITVDVTGEHDILDVCVATPNGLPGIPVTSGGNYTDASGQQWICDEIDLARGVYVHRVARAVFDGSEEWSAMPTDTTGKYRYACTLESEGMHFDKPVLPPMMCNQAAIVIVTGTYSLRNGVTTDSNGQVLYFYDDAFSAGGTELLRQHLASSPMVVLYLLATPIETPLSEEELAAYAALHTYRGNTTVSNDASAHMELEYVMDAKKYIDSKIAGAILAATVE